MLKLFYSKIVFSFIAVFLSFSTSAVTVKDDKGDFTIDYVPKRVVALEFSFVDALANIGISPVGIADNNIKDRIFLPVRKKISDWISVGGRNHPSLEVIASLNPDLIIADKDRHSNIYEKLKKIAPTLILKAKNETYTESLVSAQIIADVMNHSSEMKERLKNHKEKIEDFAKRIKKGTKVTLGLSQENQFKERTDKSYIGDLLLSLGLDIERSNKAGDFENIINLEQLATINPDYLIVIDYNKEKSLSKKWENEPLWKNLKAFQNKHIFHETDINFWDRARGLDVSEEITRIITDYLNK